MYNQEYYHRRLTLDNILIMRTLNKRYKLLETLTDAEIIDILKSTVTKKCAYNSKKDEEHDIIDALNGFAQQHLASAAFIYYSQLKEFSEEYLPGNFNLNESFFAQEVDVEFIEQVESRNLTPDCCPTSLLKKLRYNRDFARNQKLRSLEIRYLSREVFPKFEFDPKDQLSKDKALKERDSHRYFNIYRLEYYPRRYDNDQVYNTFHTNPYKDIMKDLDNYEIPSLENDKELYKYLKDLIYKFSKDIRCAYICQLISDFFVSRDAYIHLIDRLPRENDLQAFHELNYLKQNVQEAKNKEEIKKQAKASKPFQIMNEDDLDD